MNESMQRNLEESRKHLIAGRMRSKQSAYARRFPDPSSLPSLIEAKKLLGNVLLLKPDHREALLMMSEVCECVLEYEAAADYMMRAVNAGEPKTNKMLKRLALLHEQNKFWKELHLSPRMLSELGKHLESRHVGPESTTLSLTREWLEARLPSESNSIVLALAERGAFSDFQVLANVVNG